MNPDTMDRDEVVMTQYIMHGFRYLSAKCTLRNFKQIRDSESYAFLLEIITRSLRIAPSLFSFSLDLRNLSEACSLNGEYRMALKALRKVQMVCFSSDGQHIAPNFVQKQCKEQRRALKGKMSTMRCSYCSKMRKAKLRSCTGCMKAMYCNKRCQKRHWNANHRDLCVRTWSDNNWYKNLEESLARVFG